MSFQQKNKKTDACPPIEVVLGAGGSRGPAHLGLLQYLEEARVHVGTITGVSVGSIVAAIYTNTRDAQLTREIFLTQMSGQDNPLVRILKSLFNPVTWLPGKRTELLPQMQRLVKELGLSPQKDLRIIAWNSSKREPMVFQGINYDLAEALAASCSVPFVMRPVQHLTGTGEIVELVDGGVYHTYPGEFCQGRAIIAKLGIVTQWPHRLMRPLNLIAHTTELFMSRVLHHGRTDPDGHIVIDIGKPDVAGLTFGLPLQTNLDQIIHAYDTARAKLDWLITSGVIPVCPA